MRYYLANESDYNKVVKDDFAFRNLAPAYPESTNPPTKYPCVMVVVEYRAEDMFDTEFVYLDDFNFDN